MPARIAKAFLKTYQGWSRTTSVAYYRKHYKNNMKKGKVYFVGAGPAGRDLITLKGLEVLKQAEAVIYDYLVDKELLEEVNPKARLIYCAALGKDKPEDGSFKAQAKVNAAIIREAKKGRLVARLKNGDPSIFGRLSEEIKPLLKHGIEFEVVPGITAAQAASAFSGIPLTARNFSSSVVFVTGREAHNKRKSAIDWKSLSNTGTIALYMGVKNIRGISLKLIESGKPANTPVAAISFAGRINQVSCVSTLKNIHKAVKENKVRPPAIFIVGRAVRSGSGLNWLKKNKRVLFTGLSAKRYYLKGTYFHQPMVKIKPLDDYTRFDRQIKEIPGFDWIVFTSRYAVQYFFQRLNKAGFDTRSLRDIKIAAIGSSTAERLKDLGVNPDLIPGVESSKGLLNAFKSLPLKGKKIFLPHSNISDKGMAIGLTDLGAEVSSCIAYKNIMPENLPDINLDIFDEIIFTSPSGVRNFVSRYGKPAKKTVIKCIGEVTLAQAKKLNLLKK